MTETKISTRVLSGAVQTVSESREHHVTVIRPVCWQGVRATARALTLILLAALCAVNPLRVSAAAPDPVLEWIGVMNTTVLAAGTAPNVTGRVAALVSASVFDAVNGIDPQFRPLHVKPDAPHNASQRAAAIQAAYVILLHLYPAQSTTLSNQRNASLAALAATESANSIAAGVAWGQSVADAIWAWRLTDGLAPTPPANASGATPQLATITPWVLMRPSQFRLRRH